ncbi:SGNH/GDSL hydrolase family protein [Porphyromonas uenonis]
MKRRNHLYRSFGLLLIGGLLAYGLSELLVALGPIAGYQFKEFNPLSDLLDTTANQSYETLSIPLQTANDTTATELHSADSTNSKGVTTDTLTPLELSSRLMDYSEGQSALRRLRAALREGRSRSVRIAFVGDSFIEGDILVAPFRQALQQRYGGKGVGYVPLTSTVARFRQSIQQRFEGAWRQTLASKSNSRTLFTLSETFATATASASTSYKLTNADRVTLHYVSDTIPVAITYGINGGERQHVELPASHGALAEYTFPHGAVKQFELATGGGDGTRFYGVCFDGMTGISVDNYSLRGSSGTKLTAVSSALTSQLSRFRPYDLIILSYGLNVLSPKDNNDSYEWYYDAMAKSIEHIQQLYPHATILLMSLSDRATLHEGEIHPLNGVARVLRIQHRLAQRYGLLFWNTHEAMASLGGIKGFVDKGWAAKDYTHISMAGGTQLAKLLTADLIGDESK